MQITYKIPCAFISPETLTYSLLFSRLPSFSSQVRFLFIFAGLPNTSDSEVSAEYIEHEKEILLAQIQNDPKESQKPEKVIQGMITGRIKKELKEICLLDQVYVKAEDGKQTVAKYVEEVAKANGAKIAIKGFVRFETGEGIEKRQDDFAAEVAAQVAGK